MKAKCRGRRREWGVQKPDEEEEEEEGRIETRSREEERKRQAKDLMSLLMRLSSIYWNQSHHSQ